MPKRGFPVDNPTQVDLLRHGEHQLGDVICGVTNPSLTDRGMAQMEARCQGLIESGVRWDVCISSPRRRCAVFAERFSKKTGTDLVFNWDFAEVDFGEWEGLSFPEIHARFPGQWQSWMENPDQPAPHHGEKYRDFLDRVQAAWERTMASHRKKNILLISHGGVMRAIYTTVFALGPESSFHINVPHACHTRIMAYHHSAHSDWYQFDSHSPHP